MKSDSTAEKIAKAARDLLDKEGSAAVTMRRVAGAVGITPMALYRHYADRDGLINALADAGFEEMAALLAATRFRGSIVMRLRKVLDVHVDFALENPRLFELMFLEKRAGARQFPSDFKAGRSPIASQAEKLVEEGMQTGCFRKDDAWQIVFEIGAMLQGLIMLYLGGRIDMPEARFRQLCHSAFERYIHGIRK